MHHDRITQWLRWSLMLALAVGIFTLGQTTGCGPKPGQEGTVDPDGGPPGGKKKKGEACTIAGDCETGLYCYNSKCADLCKADGDCTGGDKCKNGNCTKEGDTKCKSNDDCPPGQSCNTGTGACEAVVDNNIDKVEIITPGGLLRPEQTKQFTARALNKFGATITAQTTFEWTSSAADVISVDKATGLAKATDKAGDADITATAGGKTSAPVKISNIGKAKEGSARVIVVDGDQKGISGAKVKVGDKEGDTNANGIAEIADAKPPFDIHVFHKDHSYFSAYALKKTDLFVQLTKNPDNSQAGGAKGKFNFAQVQKLFNISDDDWPNYNVGFGVAGISLSENLLDLDFNLLVGESFKVSVLGKELSLPSGLVIELAGGAGKPEFQSLGPTGRKLLWGFGGKFKLEEVSPIITGATGGDLNIGAVLSSAKPLFSKFVFGFKNDVEVKLFPRVADKDDKNGDGKKDDLIPDFDKFPKIDLVLNQKIDKPIPVTIGAFPTPQHNGKPVDLISLGIAGVMVPGIGLIPMGIDVDKVAGASGKLDVKYTERTGVLASGQFAVITMALNIPSGKDAPPLMLYGDVKLGASPPASVNVPSFLKLGNAAKIDPATRKLEGATVEGATLYQLEITDTNGKKWLVAFDAEVKGTLTLPTPAGGLEDRLATAKSISIRPIKLSDGQDLNSIMEFNSINIDRIVTVIQGFSSIAIYEKK